MADEAILRIVIVDEGGRSGTSQPGPVPATSLVPYSHFSDAPVANSVRALCSTLNVLTTDISRASASLRQLSAAAIKHPLAIVDKSRESDYVTSSSATPYERLKQLQSIHRSKLDKDALQELQRSSPKEFEAYQDEQNDLTEQFNKILTDAKLTKREMEVVEKLFFGAGNSVQVGAELGVTDGRISALTRQIAKKLGIKRAILKQMAAEGVEQAARDQAEASNKIEWLREPVPKKHAQNVPLSEQLLEDYTDKWMKEAQKKNPNPEKLAKYTSSINALKAGGEEAVDLLATAKEARVQARIAKIKGGEDMPHLSSGGGIDMGDESYDPYDAEVPGSWMDESDFDMSPMAQTLEDSTAISNAKLYSHFARGSRVDMSRGGTMPNTGAARSGQDWHPAWLTDKEFVVNAKSAERNRDVLQTANANPNVTLQAKHFGLGSIPAMANVASAGINAAGLAGVVGPAVMSTLGVAGGPIGMAISMGAQQTVQAITKLIDVTEEAAKRYGEVNPQIAQAQAMVEVKDVMADIQRGQTAGPELARYVEMQGDLQRKYEDIKIKVLLKLLPIVTAMGTALEAAMAVGEPLVEGLTAISQPLGQLVTVANWIANIQADANRPDAQDPTSLIINTVTGEAGDGLRLPPPT